MEATSIFLNKRNLKIYFLLLYFIRIVNIHAYIYRFINNVIALHTVILFYFITYAFLIVVIKLSQIFNATKFQKCQKLTTHQFKILRVGVFNCF